jgi:hypothetical protein
MSTPIVRSSCFQWSTLTDALPRHLLPWMPPWLRSRLLVIVSILVVCVVTYLPAVDNFFISDDFALFPMLKALDRDPLHIVSEASEIFRSMSYVYFWGCFKVFGMTPEPYYWLGIVLHGINSFLVYLLVMAVTRNPFAPWVAALFFAAYERHQEAVMWISAANEMVLTLNCLLFLLLWQRFQSRWTPLNMTMAAIVFAMALFSKEGAVALVPLITVDLVLRGYSRNEVVRRSLLLWVMLGAYALLWLSLAHRNSFITAGHYALGIHFLPVYARSLGRLLSQALPFLIVFLVMTTRRRAHPERGSERIIQRLATQSPWNSSFLFFAALLVLAILPYSFLTYLNHIPSRNTYFASVGLAGIIGILFGELYAALTSAHSKRICMSLLMATVVGNAAYIWLKKEPQYRERAAPTRELIEILNGRESRPVNQPIIHVCGFPLPPWVGSEAVAGFTRFNPKDVVFLESCDEVTGSTALHWDEGRAKYKNMY